MELIADDLEMNGGTALAIGVGLTAAAGSLVLGQHGNNKTVSLVQVMSKHLAACGVALNEVESRLNALERGGGGGGGDNTGLKNRVAGLEAEFQSLQERVEYLESQGFEDRITYLESVIESLMGYEEPPQTRPAKMSPVPRKRTAPLPQVPRSSAPPAKKTAPISRGPPPKAAPKRPVGKKVASPPSDEVTEYNDDDSYLADL